MTTPTNGSQLTSDADLAVIRPSAPVPAEPAAPDRTTPDPAPAVVATPTAAVYREPRNRAEETKRQRAERQGREMQITAASLLTQRVPHPDGGDSTVEEIQRQEKRSGTTSIRRPPRAPVSITASCSGSAQSPSTCWPSISASCCTSSRGSRT